MELRNITTFLRVAELQNFTHAAQELGYGDDLPRRDFRSAGHHTTTRRIVTVLASSLRMATAAPRMRYALGSPPGLCPTHSTRVPGTSPRSKSRRRIRLSVRSASTSARWPGVISSR